MAEEVAPDPGPVKITAEDCLAVLEKSDFPRIDRWVHARASEFVRAMAEATAGRAYPKLDLHSAVAVVFSAMTDCVLRHIGLKTAGGPIEAMKMMAEDNSQDESILRLSVEIAPTLANAYVREVLRTEMPEYSRSNIVKATARILAISQLRGVLEETRDPEAVKIEMARLKKTFDEAWTGALK